jgi:hypothetical protein
MDDARTGRGTVAVSVGVRTGEGAMDGPAVASVHGTARTAGRRVAARMTGRRVARGLQGVAGRGDLGKVRPWKMSGLGRRGGADAVGGTARARGARDVALWP